MLPRLHEVHQRLTRIRELRRQNLGSDDLDRGRHQLIQEQQRIESHQVTVHAEIIAAATAVTGPGDGAARVEPQEAPAGVEPQEAPGGLEPMMIDATSITTGVRQLSLEAHSQQAHIQQAQQANTQGPESHVLHIEALARTFVQTLDRTSIGQIDNQMKLSMISLRNVFWLKMFSTSLKVSFTGFKLNTHPPCNGWSTRIVRYN
ncbi:hypothetical protein BGX33_000230 [Mortierella sp. NVP41]|nr:hypothetical protein BGX33_000230 [Mortierella sp. NVP41]